MAVLHGSASGAPKVGTPKPPAMSLENTGASDGCSGHEATCGMGMLLLASRLCPFKPSMWDGCGMLHSWLCGTAKAPLMSHGMFGTPCGPLTA
jgi:hypothetical protein